MNLTFDRRLCKKYPYLFADRHEPMTVTAMCWGFECGDGWYDIIDRAAAKLEPLIKKWVVEYGNPYFPRATQVKEKFGTLRIYMKYSNEQMDAIVAGAERQSARTCERCGAPGKLYGASWLYTACKQHIQAVA